MRRAIADVAVQNEEGRTALCLLKDIERVLDSIDVVCVANAQNIPTVTQESGGDVLAEGDPGVAFDRDVVVVVNPAEMIESEMSVECRRFRTHALHHAPVAALG